MSKMNIEALAKYLALSGEDDYDFDESWPSYNAPGQDYMAVREVFNARLPRARYIAQWYADLLNRLEA